MEGVLKPVWKAAGFFLVTVFTRAEVGVLRDRRRVGEVEVKFTSRLGWVKHEAGADVVGGVCDASAGSRRECLRKVAITDTDTLPLRLLV